MYTFAPKSGFLDDAFASATAAMTPLLEWDGNDSAATRGSEKNAGIRAAIVATELKASRGIRPRCHLNISIMTLLPMGSVGLLPEKMQVLTHRHRSDAICGAADN